MFSFRTAIFATGFCLLVNGLPQGAWAFAKKAPSHLMANVGDSISAGTFADTDTFLPWSLGEALFAIFAFDNPKTLILLENKKSYSWASGEWHDSHFVRLNRHLSSKDPGVYLDNYNVAVPGSTAADTIGQAQQVVDRMKTGQHDELTYVTLMIGANDVCGGGVSGVPSDEFRANIRATFAKLAEVKQEKTIKVMVSSIPNVPLLGSLEIKNHWTMGVMSCDFARTHIFGYCKKPLNWGTQEEFAQELQYVLDKDQVLREEVAEAGRTYPGLELAFGESVGRHDVPTNILAMDCFHPNKQGHAEISEELWADQPWFK